MEKSDIISLVKFDGTNYTSWAFQFQIYLEGKELWAHIDGSDPKPETDDKKILAWKTKDAKIKTWLLGSVEPHFILNLRPCQAARDMWDYLKKIYQQSSAARQFQLELDISQYTQGTQSVQEYYNGFRRLWSEYDEIKFASVSEALLPELLRLQQSSHRDQFLMKLRLEFETVRSNLMSRALPPSLDDCLQELLREEQRLVTKSTMEQQQAVEAPLAYVANARRTPRDISKVQCHACKKYGHYANQCKVKICRYCKATGHVIDECRKKGRNATFRQPVPSASESYTVSSAPTAYTVTTPRYASSDYSAMPSGSSSQPDSSTQSASVSLTPEMVNQMIINALASMNIAGPGVGGCDREGP
eukprot:TRINITY_DN3509_c3_g1_i2.p1 TRINITY_DN3509_c3_g1~~TRINITY_DN3509_c3_g1_i2.p1  ORF type:complete len:359 (+),score=43.10 TRINITY_DN3509_c3_g1_i2:418-1494(+)